MNASNVVEAGARCCQHKTCGHQVNGPVSGSIGHPRRLGKSIHSGCPNSFAHEAQPAVAAQRHGQRPQQLVQRHAAGDRRRPPPPAPTCPCTCPRPSAATLHGAVRQGLSSGIATGTVEAPGEGRVSLICGYSGVVVKLSVLREGPSYPCPAAEDTNPTPRALHCLVPSTRP